MATGQVSFNHIFLAHIATMPMKEICQRLLLYSRLPLLARVLVLALVSQIALPVMPVRAQQSPEPADAATLY